METLMSIKVKLVQEARKSGGDKYEGEFEGEKVMPYLPQKITRKNGQVKKELILEVKDVD